MIYHLRAGIEQGYEILAVSPTEELVASLFSEECALDWAMDVAQKLAVKELGLEDVRVEAGRLAGRPDGSAPPPNAYQLSCYSGGSEVKRFYLVPEIHLGRGTRATRTVTVPLDVAVMLDDFCKFARSEFLYCTAPEYPERIGGGWRFYDLTDRVYIGKPNDIVSVLEILNGRYGISPVAFSGFIHPGVLDNSLETALKIAEVAGSILFSRGQACERFDVMVWSEELRGPECIGMTKGWLDKRRREYRKDDERVCMVGVADSDLGYLLGMISRVEWMPPREELQE